MDGEGRTTIKTDVVQPRRSELSSANNPPLRSGDVVVVDRNNHRQVQRWNEQCPRTSKSNCECGICIVRILGLPGAGSSVRR